MIKLNLSQLLSHVEHCFITNNGVITEIDIIEDGEHKIYVPTEFQKQVMLARELELRLKRDKTVNVSREVFDLIFSLSSESVREADNREKAFFVENWLLAHFDRKKHLYIVTGLKA